MFHSHWQADQIDSGEFAANLPFARREYLAVSERKYKNPSVLEAVLELRVKPSETWSISSFVEFAGAAKERGYPILKDAAQGFQVAFPVAQGAAPSVTTIANRVQTWNESETQLWQAGPQLYAANRRQPYEGWKSFRPHIFEGLDLYCNIAKPAEADALVMQYINRIELDEPELNPGELLRFLPPMIQYAEKINTFICRTDQAFSEQEQIVVTSARDASSIDKIAVILDISCVVSRPSLERSVLAELIERAHVRISDAFEKSITDKLRERMGVV